MSKLLDRESQLDTLRRTRVAPAKVLPAASASSAASTTAPDGAPVVLAAPAAVPVQPQSARHRTRLWVRLPKLALAGLAAFWISRPFVEPLMPLELPPPDAPVPVAAVPAPAPTPTVVTIEVVDVAPIAEDLMPDIVEFEELEPADLAAPDSSDTASPDTAAIPAEPTAPADAAPASPEPDQEAHPAPAVIDVMDMAMQRANEVYNSMDAALQDAAQLSRSREAKQSPRRWKFGGS